MHIALDGLSRSVALAADFHRSPQSSGVRRLLDVPAVPKCLAIERNNPPRGQSTHHTYRGRRTPLEQCSVLMLRDFEVKMFG